MTDTDNSMQTFESYLDIGYDQTYRPQYHFTSRKNWLNDPNGMVYYDGEYHLFFQHNPQGTGWGNMTWGHAVSRDMVRWEQLPHAILPYDEGTIFSGTALVDHHNTLGKQQGDVKTLVAFFTFAKNPYGQSMAYSTDKGRTFTLLNDGKCVVPNQGLIKDDRDPKVFWHAPTKKWVMVLYVQKGIARIFTSEDMQTWTMASDISREVFHECPDFVELAVLDADGTPTGESKWLLYDAGFVCSIGSFDGATFTIEETYPKSDLGANFYAAQTFSNSPDGRTVIIGWMSGSNFVEQDMPFNQQMSFPSTLELRQSAEGLRLYRWPIKEIEILYKATHVFENVTADALAVQLAGIDAERVDLSIAFEPGQDLALNIRGIEISYDGQANTFKSEVCKPLPAQPVDGTIVLRVLADRGSIELFANEGSAVATSYVLPAPENTSIQLTGNAEIRSLTVHELKSSWQGAR
ncbi:MAG: glycoside hydrolase family 32 protein [Verrucomicrobia bacterium]|jgi:fructan beta-fructosidase|nr:glycoside hydrolase family 32 protein [Verrucomicrobiota bacterium]MBT7068925.1 glycoside hydrolase family 32 protein [Verrucomicrobiota bacterium]MBT7701743.1 glycoside hydrolase family 32 protein [Verrucomicrobiota bacterium]